MIVRNALLDMLVSGLKEHLGADVYVEPNYEFPLSVGKLPLVNVTLGSDYAYLDETDWTLNQTAVDWLSVEVDFGMAVTGGGKYRQLNDLRQKIDDWVTDPGNFGGVIVKTVFESYQEEPDEEVEKEKLILQAGLLYQVVVDSAVPITYRPQPEPEPEETN